VEEFLRVWSDNVFPVDVIDPAKNNGKSCIVLGGRHKTWFPERISDIRIGRKAVPVIIAITGATR